MPRTKTWPAFLGLLLLLVTAGGLALARLSSGDAPEPAMVVYRVAIDPGHGDYDPGAIGVGGVLEKDVVLEIAQLVYLRSLSYPQFDVRLTRRSDEFLSLSERIGAANAWDADVYVSIHANSYSDSDVAGTETMIDKSEAWGSESAHLAQLLQDQLVQAIGSRDRGVKQATLYLWRADMPAALVELGFLTNPDEAEALQQLSVQTRIADAILEGIVRFLDGS